MLYKDINTKSVDELQKLINDLKAELWTLKFRNATGSLDQSHKIKQVRRDIAKCLTALRNKQLEGAK